MGWGIAEGGVVQGGMGGVQSLSVAQRFIFNMFKHTKMAMMVCSLCG